MLYSWLWLFWSVKYLSRRSRVNWLHSLLYFLFPLQFVMGRDTQLNHNTLFPWSIVALTRECMRVGEHHSSQFLTTIMISCREGERESVFRLTSILHHHHFRILLWCLLEVETKLSERVEEIMRGSCHAIILEIERRRPPGKLNVSIGCEIHFVLLMFCRLVVASFLPSFSLSSLWLPLSLLIYYRCLSFSFSLFFYSLMDELVFSWISRNTTTHKCKTRKVVVASRSPPFELKEKRKKRTRKSRGDRDVKDKKWHRPLILTYSSQWRECVSCIFPFCRHHVLFPVFLSMCPLPSWHHWQEEWKTL